MACKWHSKSLQRNFPKYKVLTIIETLRKENNIGLLKNFPEIIREIDEMLLAKLSREKIELFKGVKDILQNIPLKKCVASSASLRVLRPFLLASSLAVYFDKSVQEVHQWLKDIYSYSSLDTQDKALIAPRVVLRKSRDSLTLNNAVNLSAEFPALIKGLLFENLKTENKIIKEIFLNKNKITTLDIESVKNPKNYLALVSINLFIIFLKRQKII